MFEIIKVRLWKSLKPFYDDDKRMIREFIWEYLQSSPSETASRRKIQEAVTSNEEMPFVRDRIGAVNQVIDKEIEERGIEVVPGTESEQQLRIRQFPFVKFPKEWLP